MKKLIEEKKQERQPHEKSGEAVRKKKIKEDGRPISVGLEKDHNITDLYSRGEFSSVVNERVPWPAQDNSPPVHVGM
jgi:hypothetical protein